MSRKKRKKKKIEEPSPFLPPSYQKEILGFSLLALSLLVFLSTSHFAKGTEARHILGIIGHAIGWSSLALFGIPIFLLLGFISYIGYRFLVGKEIQHLRYKIYTFSLLIFSLSMLFHVVEEDQGKLAKFFEYWFFEGLWHKKMRFHLGGAPSYYLYQDFPFFNFSKLLNRTGTLFFFGLSFILSFCILFKVRISFYLKKIFFYLFKKKEDSLQKPFEEQEESFLRFVKLRLPSFSNKKQEAHSSEILEIQPERKLLERPSLSKKELKDLARGEKSFLDRPEERLSRKDILSSGPFSGPLGEKEEIEIFPTTKIRTSSPPSFSSPPKERKANVKTKDFSSYSLPEPDLLTTAKWVDQSNLKKDLKRQAEVLEETLSSFSIEAKVGQINCGPTITSFEVHPSIGVKVQKIKTLENDIALNMEAKSIRIIAPIPGKAAVGIEVPNAVPQEVGFKEMLSAYQQRKQNFRIPILLGKAVNGDYVMSDLTKMPHCIIAGATGSGKSVCINTIVMSILMTARPDEIKLVMVDPKKVELTPYSKLPHMLAPVITEPQGATAALKWLVKEMENRYEILKLVGHRNIESFNARVKDAEKEITFGKEIPDKMYFIVLIVDELADLMMVASQDIETPIARLAQMARAVGIHVILATQRPSREVITGLIKANFPTRIAFKVASRINSQIILDETGAESLLGNGDLLFLPPGTSHLIRAQGAYIRDHDINRVIEAICSQSPPAYVIDSFDQYDSLFSAQGFEEEDPEDSLYPQALDIVTSTGNASTTFLQRKLKIGYARAASLMDALERNGIVSPQEGSKPRRILKFKNSLNADADVSDASLPDDF